MAADKPRLRIYGEPELALPYIGAANNLLFRVRQVAENAGVPIYSLTENLADGTTIKAAVSGRFSEISIHPVGGGLSSSESMMKVERGPMLAVLSYRYSGTSIDITLHKWLLLYDIASGKWVFSEYETFALGDRDEFLMDDVGRPYPVSGSGEVFMRSAGSLRYLNYGPYANNTAAPYEGWPDSRKVLKITTAGFAITEESAGSAIAIDRDYIYASCEYTFSNIVDDQDTRLAVRSRVAKFDKVTFEQTDISGQLYTPTLRNSRGGWPAPPYPEIRHLEGVTNISNEFNGYIAVEVAYHPEFNPLSQQPGYNQEPDYFYIPSDFLLIRTEDMEVVAITQLSRKDYFDTSTTPDWVNLYSDGEAYPFGEAPILLDHQGLTVITTGNAVDGEFAYDAFRRVTLPITQEPGSLPVFGEPQQVILSPDTIKRGQSYYRWVFAGATSNELIFHTTYIDDDPDLGGVTPVLVHVHSRKTGKLITTSTIELPPIGSGYKWYYSSQGCVVSRDQARYMINAYKLRNPPE